MADFEGAQAVTILDRDGADPRSTADAFLVGRKAEWEALRHAFRASREGRPVLAAVHGPSGIGKRFLIQCFLREIQQEHPGAVVLAGRCCEEEPLPHQALHGLMEPLAQVLADLPRPELAGLLPPHLPFLARLFPVLRHLRDLAPDPGPTEAPDPQEFRLRAFGALGDLLRGLGRRGPLVLFIDDLQWADPDSATQLARLFLAPDAPAMLLLAAHRSEEGKPSPALQAFRDLAPGAAVHLVLEELPGPDARRLARAMLGPGSARAQQRSAWIALESGGNPFAIAELCRHAALEPAPALTLDQCIRARVAELPEEGRRVLACLALAGHPVAEEVLARACGFHQVPAELFLRLRAAGLARVRGLGRNLLEPGHDRIRACVAGAVPIPGAREIHRSLGRAMERSAESAPLVLHRHFLHAEELDKAAIYAEKAAKQAARAMAFDLAARLYRRALALQPPRAEARARLLVQLGAALAHAGLDAEAAGACQDASRLFQGLQALRLRRLAAQHFFRCGQFDQGLAALEAVFRALGMKLPASPRIALLSLLFRRFLTRIRGLDARLRGASRIPAAQLDRIDICWTGAMGLGPIDPIRGGVLQARGLALALEAGEPSRLVRALAHETVYAAHRGNRSLAAARRTLAATRALAEQMGEPGPMARACIAAGTAALMQGRWKDAVAQHGQAEALLRDHCAGMDYELHIAQHHGMACLWVLGQVREVAARLPAALQTAWDKGDLLALTNLRTSIAPYLCLARDEPDHAAWEIRQAMGKWSTAGFHLQHYNALVAQANIHLYEGEPLAAWEALTTQWAPLRASFLLKVQAILVTMLELRARTALAVVLQVPDPGDRAGMSWLKGARADLRALVREKTSYGAALALKLQALEALVAERTREAAGFLSRAESAFEACDMGLHVLSVRQARGALQDGPDAARDAEARMRSLGIVNPERFARMHVPISSA